MIGDAINTVQKDLAVQVMAVDGALIWLSDNSKTTDAVKALMAMKDELGIDTVNGPAEIGAMFGDAAKDGRVPDITIKSQVGVIYAGAKPPNWPSTAATAKMTFTLA